ncbi:MAG TPA: mismatch-specific DNA-glycosylase [bacterium]|nr:mismatch-specific DNA-glycosylase [bacterium]
MMVRRLRTEELLPDIIDNNVRILFVGLAPSEYSAECGHYHADEDDEFYQLLFDAKLTSEQVMPHRDHRLPEFRIGLTHLSNTNTLADVDEPDPVDYAVGKLIRLVFTRKPCIVCFIGKAAFKQFYDLPTDYGLQKQRIGTARVFVVPDSHPARRKDPQADVIKFYRQLYESGKEHYE